VPRDRGEIEGDGAQRRARHPLGGGCDGRHQYPVGSAAWRTAMAPSIPARAVCALGGYPWQRLRCRLLSSASTCRGSSVRTTLCIRGSWRTNPDYSTLS